MDELEIQEEETLETVPEEWSEIVIESDESSISFGDGSIYNFDNPLPVIVVDPTDDTSEEIETTEEVTEIYLEDVTEEAPVVVKSLNRSNDSRSLGDSGFRNLWVISVNNTEYTVLFPDAADLEVVNGYLYNRSSSNITGIIIDNNFSDSSYIRRTITVMSLPASNTQTTVYRYGSRIYFTDYSPGTNNNLQSTVSYIHPEVVSRPSGWSLSKADMLICGLLLFSVLVSILGGIIRR